LEDPSRLVRRWRSDQAGGTRPAPGRGRRRRCRKRTLPNGWARAARGPMMARRKAVAVIGQSDGLDARRPEPDTVGHGDEQPQSRTRAAAVVRDGRGAGSLRSRTPRPARSAGEVFFGRAAPLIDRAVGKARVRVPMKTGRPARSLHRHIRAKIRTRAIGGFVDCSRCASRRRRRRGRVC